MSSEQERHLRIAAAIVQSGCWVLGVERNDFLRHDMHVCEIHAAAMDEAMVRLRLPLSARREYIAFRHYPSMMRCVFFGQLINFYEEQGRKEAAK